MKSLNSKLDKLCRVYSADIYFLARRNGRVVECISADAAGRQWSPPNQAALVSLQYLSNYN